VTETQENPEVEEQSVPELPEVRQCADSEHFLYGASAVAAGENRWGVMHPVNGGHWSDDAGVEGWPVLSQ